MESRSAGGGAAAQLACQCSHGSMGGPEGLAWARFTWIVVGWLLGRSQSGGDTEATNDLGLQDALQQMTAARLHCNSVRKQDAVAILWGPCSTQKHWAALAPDCYSVCAGSAAHCGVLCSIMHDAGLHDAVAGSLQGESSWAWLSWGSFRHPGLKILRIRLYCAATFIRGPCRIGWSITKGTRDTRRRCHANHHHS